MKRSVILTVYNRQPPLLANTLTALASALSRHGKDDTEVLIVNDGSTQYLYEYEKILSLLQKHFASLKWVTVETLEDRPQTYHINGAKNPAYANNRAVEKSQGENLFWLSSDCIIQPNAFLRADKWDLNRYIWTCKVENMRDGAQFLGPKRIFPACWFIAHSRRLFDEIGGFDEHYMNGMAFEDTDYTATMACKTGKLVIDCMTKVYHQWHPPVNYSDDWKGFERSAQHIVSKWNGIPWSGYALYDPLSWSVTSLGDCLLVEAKRKPDFQPCPSDIYYNDNEKNRQIWLRCETANTAP